MGLSTSHSRNNDKTLIPYNEAKQIAMKERKDIAFVTVFFNFTNFPLRTKLYYQFKERLKQMDIDLFTVECVFPGQSFAVTNADSEFDIQLESKHVFWVKENCLNISLEKLKGKFKYFAWLDCDLEFRNKNLAVDAIIALQSHKIVQLFENGSELDDKGQIFKSSKSFCYYVANGYAISKKNFKTFYPHPGFAWTARVDTLEKIQFFDKSPIGTGDLHMAYAFIGKNEDSCENFPSEMYKEVNAWGKKAFEEVKGDLGYVCGEVIHHFHGFKANRRNNQRCDMLRKHNFQPKKHICQSSEEEVYTLRDCENLEECLKEFFEVRDSDKEINN